MNDAKEEFLKSLDLIDEEIEEYIPFLFEDLWELGGLPECMVELLKQNPPKKEIKNILDLGCGKGAALIKLGLEFEFEGLGIDLVPEFIEYASKKAEEYKLSHRLRFEAGNIKDYINKERKYDILIYGYDSHILGDIRESINILEYCINKDGYIILEAPFTLDSGEGYPGLPKESEIFQQINDSKCKLIDKIIWDIGKVKEMNRFYNEMMASRVNILSRKYPEKAQLFERFLENQIIESEKVENVMICTTWLLEKR